MLAATDGKTYVVALNATAEQLGRVCEGDLVRVSGGKKGYPNLYLQTRLSLQQQVAAKARTWLDEKLLQQDLNRAAAGARGASKFAREVAEALEARRAVLRERGLIIGPPGGERFVPQVLRKLYDLELEEFHRRLGHQYGARLPPSQRISGRLEVQHLPSGPHAVLRTARGYYLTPLRPKMTRLISQKVEITLSARALTSPLDRGASVQIRALGRDLGRGR